MEITRRTDYAIRVLMYLANTGEGAVSVREIADRQHVPYAFARSVQRDLAAAGLVRTVRGAKGGVLLAVDPGELSLLDIVTAIQGRPSFAACSHDPAMCEFSSGCAVHRAWCDIDGMVRDYLRNKTLAGLQADD